MSDLWRTAAHPSLAAMIGRVESRYIDGAAITDVFDPLLTDLLEVTESEYGFIAELLHHPQDGHAFLRIYVLTDISWNDATRRIFLRHRSGEQPVEFHNMNTLFGQAVRTGEPVIANDPANDPRRGGLPDGHPPMGSFLGVPLFRGGRMVGVVGLSNRQGGYDIRLVEELAPLFSSAGAIIDSFRMSQALRESERLLHQSFEMAAVGIAHLQRDGRFVRVNRKLCEIVGHARPTLLGMHLDGVADPSDADGRRAGIEALFEGRTLEVSGEHRLRHANGQRRWASLTMSLARDSGGAPSHVIAVFEDITARIEAAEALHAAEAAERANAARSRFLSQVSHELRTPLNAVLGFSQVLRLDPDRPLSAWQADKLRHIEDAGLHLLSMIDDVLDLSRMDSDTLRLSVETLPVHGLVTQSIALVSGTAEAAGIRIDVRPADPTAEVAVRADAARLRQVLVNLLSNAVKYNRPGGHVHVTWRATEPAAEVTLSVTDSGQGLAPEQLAHLFEPFNRLGAEGTAIPGTGIGLVVCQRLVHLMGGRLAVESELGAGSRFHVTLPGGPVEPPPRETPADAAPRAAHDRTAASPPSRRTVLYAEDNEVNVELMRSVMLLRPQIELAVASTGAATLAWADDRRPDLFLLDMHLGDMSGLDLQRRLAQRPHLAGVPFVALTADAMPDSTTAALGAGFAGYLTKPIHLPDLLATLDRLLAVAPPATH